MNITLKVSQSQKADKAKAYGIYASLFAVEEKKFSMTKVGVLSSEIIKFQHYLKKEFPKSEYSFLESVVAKIDVCVDFDYNGLVKNHKISIPLTLFFIYTKEQLEDISNHLFLKLYEQWSNFYEESIKIKEE